jgi:hypothetical protein
VKEGFEGRRRRHHAEYVTAAVSGQTLSEHSGSFATAWSRHEMATGFQRVLRAVPLVLRRRRRGRVGFGGGGGGGEEEGCANNA